MTGKHGGARRGAGRPQGKVSATKILIAEAAQEHAADALSVLLSIAQDPEAAAAARVSAANHILDRGYGKPIAPQEHKILGNLADAFKEAGIVPQSMPIATARRG